MLFIIYKNKKVKAKVSQSCLTLCDPKDYTIHGILQARIQGWVAFPFSRGSSQPRDRTQVSRIVRRFFTSWASRSLTWSHLDLSCLDPILDVLPRDATISLLLILVKFLEGVFIAPDSPFYTSVSLLNPPRSGWSIYVLEFSENHSIYNRASGSWIWKNISQFPIKSLF